MVKFYGASRKPSKPRGQRHHMVCVVARPLRCAVPCLPALAAVVMARSMSPSAAAYSLSLLVASACCCCSCCRLCTGKHKGGVASTQLLQVVSDWQQCMGCYQCCEPHMAAALPGQVFEDKAAQLPVERHKLSQNHCSLSARTPQDSICHQDAAGADSSRACAPIHAAHAPPAAPLVPGVPAQLSTLPPSRWPAPTAAAAFQWLMHAPHSMPGGTAHSTQRLQSVKCVAAVSMAEARSSLNAWAYSTQQAAKTVCPTCSSLEAMQGAMMLHCEVTHVHSQGCPISLAHEFIATKDTTQLHVLCATPLKHLLCPTLQLCLPTCSRVSSKPLSFSSPISWLCDTSDLLADSRLDSSSSSCCCRN